MKTTFPTTDKLLSTSMFGSNLKATYETLLSPNTKIIQNVIMMKSIILTQESVKRLIQKQKP